MNTQNASNVICNANKFQSAEQLWFWFLYSKSIQNGFARGHAPTRKRVCEVLDVETLITKLYLCGKLSDAHLNVMKKFGDRRRAPHQYIWTENRAAGLWNDAMKIIEDAASERGWIE